MTPNEITTLVASKFRKEMDIPFKKMLYESVKYWRSTLIKQTVDKRPMDGKFFRQTIYLPMQQVQGFPPIPTATRWKTETILPVPIPIRVADQVFDYVGGVDGISPMGYADEGTLEPLRAGRYSRLSVYYSYKNRKVNTTNQDLQYIQISAIFNSPEEAMIYETVPSQPNIDWWNQDIPMSGDIEQRVVQCLLKVDFEKLDQTKKTDDYQVPVNDEEL